MKMSYLTMVKGCIIHVCWVRRFFGQHWFNTSLELLYEKGLKEEKVSCLLTISYIQAAFSPHSKQCCVLIGRQK